MGMANYLSRHPSESNSNKQKTKEELWNTWFTVNELTRNNETVSAYQKSQASSNQTMGAKLASAMKLASESERQASVEKPSGEEL